MGFEDDPCGIFVAFYNSELSIFGPRRKEKKIIENKSMDKVCIVGFKSLKFYPNLLMENYLRLKCISIVH